MSSSELAAGRVAGGLGFTPVSSNGQDGDPGVADDRPNFRQRHQSAEVAIGRYLATGRSYPGSWSDEDDVVHSFACEEVAVLARLAEELPRIDEER